jgi:hypothetical protein
LLWKAELNSGGDLDISYGPTIGRPNDHMAITVDSHGYAIGSYSTQIVISSELDMPGSPVILPVELIVVDNLNSTFLPNVLK